MADLLNIGLSALLAQQRALTTTANNIANASTPGYSRQRVELTERTAERMGSDFVGTGVDVALTRRLSDDLLAEQLRTAAGGFHRAEAFVSLAESLDDMLAGTETGLTATLQAFANALQDVANDPSSTSSRQALLSEARNLIVAPRCDGSAADGARRRGPHAHDGGGRPDHGVGRRPRRDQPPADRRRHGDGPAGALRSARSARPVARGAVQARAGRRGEQRDGTTSVFIGTGQVLVLGGNAAQVAVTPGNADPLQPQVVIRGIGPDVNVTQFVTGGELGGAVDFNRELLAPTRSELGRIAVGLVTTVNAVHRNGMDAEGQLGGDFFSIGAPETFSGAANTGTGSLAVTITGVAALEPTNYQLTFDGAAYTLQRVDNGAVVPMTGAGTSLSPFVANGLSIVVSGTPAASDQFYLKPLEHVAGTRLVARESAGGRRRRRADAHEHRAHEYGYRRRSRRERSSTSRTRAC